MGDKETNNPYLEQIKEAIKEHKYSKPNSNK